MKLSEIGHEPAVSKVDHPASADPRPPARWIAWLETGVLAVIAPLVGLKVQPDDPFFLKSGFPWPGLAPVLAGLRYGFPQGLGCALMSLLALLAASKMGMGPSTGAVVGQFTFGVLALGMVSGQFRDLWSKRIEKAQADAAFRKGRLDEFTRIYHLLRVSHHKLEQRLAGGTPSLREMLFTLRDALLLARLSDEPLMGISPQVLDIFMSHGGVLVACMFEVGKDGKCGEAPVAYLGSMAPPPTTDKLLVEGLRTGDVVSVNDLFTTRVESATELLVVVPLVDIHERVWGLVAIQDMHFVAFQEDNLRMLAILGGYVADLLATRLRGTADPTGERFNHHLLRAVHSLRNHGEPAAVVKIHFGLGQGVALVEPIRNQRRGLNSQWLDTDADGAPVMLVVMPMSDWEAVDGFLRLVTELSRNHLGAAPEEAGVRIRTHVLEPHDTEETVIAALGGAARALAVADAKRLDSGELLPPRRRPG